MYAVIDESAMYSPMNQPLGGITSDGYHTILDRPSAQGRAFIRPDSVSSAQGSTPSSPVTVDHCIIPSLAHSSTRAPRFSGHLNFPHSGEYSKTIHLPQKNITANVVSHAGPSVGHLDLKQGNDRECDADGWASGTLTPNGGYTIPDVSSSNQTGGTSANRSFHNVWNQATLEDSGGYVKPDFNVSNSEQGTAMNSGYQNIPPMNTDSRANNTSNLSQSHSLENGSTKVQEEETIKRKDDVLTPADNEETLNPTTQAKE